MAYAAVLTHKVSGFFNLGTVYFKLNDGINVREQERYMTVYVIGFSLSTALLALSPKIKKSQRLFVDIIALLIPCLIAGFRADSVGTDVQAYLVNVFDAAVQADGLKEYFSTSWYYIWHYLYVSDYEIAFTLLVYIVSKITGSVMAVQFFLQVLVVFPIYVALKNLNSQNNDDLTKKDYSFRYPIWLGMLTYYLMIFNTTLNLMRQAIAIAFVLLAFSYMLMNKKKNMILAWVIAFLFHTSAVLAILILAAYKFINVKNLNVIGYRGERGASTKAWRNRTLRRMWIIIAIGILVLLGINVFTNILKAIGLSSYVSYVSGMVKFMPNQLIARLPIFILFLVSWKHSKEKNMYFFFAMLCLDLICSQFTSVNSFGGRVAMYFSEYEILSFPTMYNGMKRNKLFLTLVIAYMIFYWWFYFVYSGANATVPYEFGF